MKNCLFIIVCFFCFNAISQEYQFDYFLEYRNYPSNSVSSYFINSENTNYYLYLKPYENQLEGNLESIDSDNIHLFNVTTENNSIVFNYKDSQKKKIKDETNPYRIESTIVKNTDGTSTLTIFGYRNKRKKNPRKMEVIYDNSNFYYPKRLVEDLFHGTLNNREIETPKGIPLKINILFENGYEVRSTNIKKQKTNITLSSKK